MPRRSQKEDKKSARFYKGGGISIRPSYTCSRLAYRIRRVVAGTPSLRLAGKREDVGLLAVSSLCPFQGAIFSPYPAAAPGKAAQESQRGIPMAKGWTNGNHHVNFKGELENVDVERKEHGPTMDN